MAIMKASLANGTGILFINMGTKIPPPVHMKIMLMNLYAVDVPLADAYTLFPEL